MDPCRWLAPDDFELLALILSWPACQYEGRSDLDSATAAGFRNHHSDECQNECQENTKLVNGPGLHRNGLDAKPSKYHFFRTRWAGIGVALPRGGNS
jgi:hypothetical protein